MFSHELPARRAAAPAKNFPDDPRLLRWRVPRSLKVGSHGSELRQSCFDPLFKLTDQLFCPSNLVVLHPHFRDESSIL